MADQDLKPVSALQRKFLSKLGMTPQVFQDQTLKVKMFGSKVLRAHDTKPSVRDLNRATLDKMNGVEPVSVVIQKLNALDDKAKEFNIDDWLPLHYTLFLRRSICKNCGEREVCLDLPNLFLCHRKRGKSPTAERLYLPVKAVAYPLLPRLEETHLCTIPFCHNCFLKEPTCPENNLSPSPEDSLSQPVDTVLSLSVAQTMQVIESLNSLSPQVKIVPSGLNGEESAGSQDSTGDVSEAENLTSTQGQNGGSESSENHLLPVLASVYHFLTGKPQDASEGYSMFEGAKV